MANKFKVGDRVVAIENHDNADIKGKSGKVVCAGNNIGIEFDKLIKTTSGTTIGHTCGGNAKHRHGWYVPAHKLKLEATPDPDPGEWKVEIEYDLEQGIKDFLETAKATSKIDFPVDTLTEVEKFKLIVASVTYPYAVKDSNGDLWFYKTVPTNAVCYIETKSIKI